MKKYFDLPKQTWTEFGEDKAPRLGAALAYYTTFSVAPLLLIAVSIAGLVFGREAAMGRISGELSSVFGASTAKALEERLRTQRNRKSGKSLRSSVSSRCCWARRPFSGKSKTR